MGGLVEASYFCTYFCRLVGALSHIVGQVAGHAAAARRYTSVTDRVTKTGFAASEHNGTDGPDIESKK